MLLVEMVGSARFLEGVYARAASREEVRSQRQRDIVRLTADRVERER